MKQSGCVLDHVDPATHRLAADIQAAFGEQKPDVAVAQLEPEDTARHQRLPLCSLWMLKTPLAAV
jgi:hypothetical protein